MLLKGNMPISSREAVVLRGRQQSYRAGKVTRKNRRALRRSRRVLGATISPPGTGACGMRLEHRRKSALTFKYLVQHACGEMKYRRRDGILACA